MVILPRAPAGPYSSNRLFEWIMAGGLLLIAFTLALPGDSLDRGALRLLVATGFSEDVMAVLFAVIGSMRAFALFANGKLPFYGPLMRYAGSFVGALVWALMMSPLAYDSLLSGKVSFIVPLLGMLTLGELISVYRAVRDGGFRKR
ncbi:MAG TPA: hypothetical protein VGV17_02925 [Bosea sp. (in: a-proteobacteria)]|uniref:hypothetical protein n=1 Tax=Bosea sp. (in: a-proteobacteria) TaxID=1871050 RepID=UPI002DDD584C|nr:hypothetical protein [Bosea sp. (in: a-proteobacteria)]HEV2552698.1 hypothetical protein [Bosea sp. (in: a-proteobacteria)]